MSALPAFLVLSLIVAATPLVAQPTANEQAFIYELNRARHDPPAYAAENGLGTLLDSVAPSQPLAVNNNLVTSSRFHSTEMAQNGYFAHTSAITGDQPNKMARDASYLLDSGLPDAANNIESLAVKYTSSSGGISYGANESLAALIEDVGVNPPGHRYHLLSTGPSKSFYDQFREIGTGYATGFQPEIPYNSGTAPDGSGAYWAIHTGFRDADSAWLTGVVYNDANSNGRYDQGEGIGGVTVTATGASTLMATTNAFGGWSIAVAAGNWTVSCTGGSFSGTGSADASVSTLNVEVDFVSGDADGIVDFVPATPSGPAITVSVTSRSFNIAAVGTPSSPQNFTVSGVNLTADISINVSANFQISLTAASGYTNVLTLTQAGGAVASTTIYVRYNPASGTSHNGTVTHSSSGATTKTVNLAGTVGTPPVGGTTSGGDSGGGSCSGSQGSSAGVMLAALMSLAGIVCTLRLGNRSH
ncbi:MAG: hypothetical protein IT462_07455 [Planctomycetes bacterium]|nr:hypothetical protein [Planctomycetota bacterium]